MQALVFGERDQIRVREKEGFVFSKSRCIIIDKI